jgi:hypothetical protein
VRKKNQETDSLRRICLYMIFYIYYIFIAFIIFCLRVVLCSLLTVSSILKTGLKAWSRDVNGDPIPANSWGIPLLGYGYKTKIVPMSMDIGQNLHPLGKQI